MPWMNRRSSSLLTGLSSLELPFMASVEIYLLSPLFTSSLLKNCFVSQILLGHALPSCFQPFENILSDIWWTIQNLRESLTSWLALAESCNTFWITSRSSPLLGKKNNNETNQDQQKNHQHQRTKKKFKKKVLLLLMTVFCFPQGTETSSCIDKGYSPVSLKRNLEQNPHLGTTHHPPKKPVSLHWT